MFSPVFAAHRNAIQNKIIKPPIKPDLKQANCFGEDTRVLTDRGFLSLEELLPLMADQGQQAGRGWRQGRSAHADADADADAYETAPVRFACYDVAREQLVYCSGVLVLPENLSQTLLAFSAQIPGRSDEKPVSLRVTPDHTMFVQEERGESESALPSSAFEHLSAAELLRPSGSGSSRTKARAVRMHSCVSGGLAVPAIPAVELEFARALSLRSEEQVSCHALPVRERAPGRGPGARRTEPEL